ncbi:hypothetical protein CPLU01_02076 [Colletotrichum plurivorum]|uniref:Uncharacterized protein n=1 Tax=Colletotrichum plurivorum TaxID=2175906 RepID=A0A8H6KWP4_9PEZI|nr:hypothetical protein CPLU01_02076 [Colletotrichum plurivorum]
MDRLDPDDSGSRKPQTGAEKGVLDLKHPVSRFPDSFSANLDRQASSFSFQDSQTGNNQTCPPPLPENQSIIHRKRDVAPGNKPELPTHRNRQVSAASSDGVRTSIDIPDEEIDGGDAARLTEKKAKQEKAGVDRRCHERVNTAHADSRLFSLENNKSNHELFYTGIKKAEIVSGLGSEKQTVDKFEEEAYAARSIACHTLKPAPLRLPSRTKQPAIGENKTDVKAPLPLNFKPAVALQPNTHKNRMISGDYQATVFKSYETKNNRSASASQVGAINFSRPKTQQPQSQIVHGPSGTKENSTFSVDKKAYTLPTYASKDVFRFSPSKMGASQASDDIDKENIQDFSNTSKPRSVDACIAAEAGMSKVDVIEAHQSQAHEANQTMQGQNRHSYTADEYQDLIQGDFERFSRDSPEKQRGNQAPVAPSLSPTTTGQGDIVPQTIVFNGQFPQPQPLAGTRAAGGSKLPPTPSSNQSTDLDSEMGRKMAMLDDFFDEKNDEVYDNLGPDYGPEQTQPWDDPNWNEDVLAYGYASMKTNYDPFVDEGDPVPLTRAQRREVLHSYGMTEAEYPAPPAGYPTPSGVAEGSIAPPCPTRPPPPIPIPGDGEAVQVQSLRSGPRRFQRAATAPSAPGRESPAAGYDADWF